MKTHQTPRSRLLAISGVSLALVVVGSAAVSAHRGDEMDQRGFGMERGGQHFSGGGGIGQGMLGLRDGLRGALEMGADALVRREMIVQTEDGIITQRLDHGNAASATDSVFAYTLATGETVEVSIDDETQVLAITEQTIELGLRSRIRMVPTEIAITEIEADSEIGVWAESQADGSFLAQRIVVHPDLDEAAATGDEAAATSDDAASVPATDA